MFVLLSRDGGQQLPLSLKWTVLEIELPTHFNTNYSVDSKLKTYMNPKISITSPGLPQQMEFAAK